MESGGAEDFCAPSCVLLRTKDGALSVSVFAADIDILCAAEAEASVFKVSALSSQPGVPERYGREGCVCGGKNEENEGVRQKNRTNRDRKTGETDRR